MTNSCKQCENLTLLRRVWLLLSGGLFEWFISISRLYDSWMESKNRWLLYISLCLVFLVLGIIGVIAANT